MINKQQFTAPNQEIENAIVNYCLNQLGLPFGSFWYEWFDSNLGNVCLKIYSEHDYLETLISQTILSLDEIGAVKVLEISKIDLVKYSLAETIRPEVRGASFLYQIHLKRAKSIEEYSKAIGKRVQKVSNKPFKSRLRYNTVIGVRVHSQTGKPAFIFAEDDSEVECHMCSFPKK